MADQASGTYTYAQLMSLWIQAGGSKLNAAMAAAIAMAESGGNPNSTDDDSNGTADRGLWQINSTHGSLSSYDPLTNARAAVQLSNNGTTWRPWCTAYSDGACGTEGGTYLGSGSPFMKFLGNAGLGSAINTGTNTTANTGTQYASFPTTQDSAWYNWIIPLTNIPGFPGSGSSGGSGGGTVFGLPLGGVSSTIESGIASAIMDVLKPVGRVLLYTLYVVGGLALMGMGIMYMVKDLDASQVFKPGGGDSDSDGALKEGEALEKSAAGVGAPPTQGGGRTAKAKRGGTRRGPASQQGSSQVGGTGRHRGQQAREGRTQKLATAQKAEQAGEAAAV